MRTEIFKGGHYYHLYNAGVANLDVFLDDLDYYRFLFLILHYQSPRIIRNTSYYTERIARDGGKKFRTTESTIEMIANERTLRLLGYSLLPHRYDIIIWNGEDLSGSVYMQRVLTAYSKYFNSKYARIGPVFAGPFKYKRLGKRQTAESLLMELHADDSPWSSKDDYSHNHWGKLLDTKMLWSK